MGIIYYAVNHENKTSFECGKNSFWKDLDVLNVFYEETLKEEFRENIYPFECYPEYHKRNDMYKEKSYVDHIANKFKKWIGDSDLEKINIIRDEEYFDLRRQGYTQTGSVYL